jgi:hypothetical protein
MLLISWELISDHTQTNHDTILISHLDFKNGTMIWIKLFQKFILIIVLKFDLNLNLNAWPKWSSIEIKFQIQTWDPNFNGLDLIHAPHLSVAWNTQCTLQTCEGKISSNLNVILK